MEHYATDIAYKKSPAYLLLPFRLPKFLLLPTPDSNSRIMRQLKCPPTNMVLETQDAHAAVCGNANTPVIKSGAVETFKEDFSTSLPVTGPPSLSNITFISAHLALKTTWASHTNILTACSSETPGPSRTFVNYRKADLEAFTNETEASFAQTFLSNRYSPSENHHLSYPVQLLQIRFPRKRFPHNLFRKRLHSSDFRTKHYSTGARPQQHP